MTFYRFRFQCKCNRAPREARLYLIKTVLNILLSVKTWIPLGFCASLVVFDFQDWLYHGQEFGQGPDCIWVPFTVSINQRLRMSYRERPSHVYTGHMFATGSSPAENTRTCSSPVCNELPRRKQNGEKKNPLKFINCINNKTMFFLHCRN